MDLALDLHMTLQDDGDREEDEQQICQDVANSHCEEMRISLTAGAARIRKNLPVILSRSTFGEVTNDNGGKSSDENPANCDQCPLRRPFPSNACQSTEEF